MFKSSPISAAFWAVWLLGAAANTLRLSSVLKHSRLEAGAKWCSLFGIVVTAALSPQINQRFTIPLIGLLGLAFLSSGGRGEDLLTSRLDKRLADFSYSLYVTHLQLQCFIAATLVECHLLPVTGITSWPNVLLYAFILLAPSLIVAFAFGNIFEARTHKLSAWLKQNLVAVVPATPGI